MMKDTAPLTGKIALVTGGSRGIGAAIVMRLANEGADVAFSYSASKPRADAVVKDIEALGRQAAALQADQASTEDAANLVKEAVKRFGRLDILVNSAGVFVTGVVGDPQADIEKLDRQLDINLKGVVATVRAAVPLMSDGGRIISIGTSGADRIQFPGMSDYIASKAAIAAYTRGWSRDLGARQITVNVIQPGPINTEMNPENGPFAETMKALTALGRYGQPQDIAAMVAFLASPDANYITGSTFAVDGGLNA